MSTAKKVAKSTVTIMFFVLLSKILGFFRDILIASRFGSGTETDAYFAASTACTFIVGMLATAIHTSTIPIFSEIQVTSGNKHKVRFMNNILNITIFFTVILSIISWIYAPIIIKIVAKGFRGEQYNLAVRLTRIGIPMLIFMVSTSIFSSFLKSSEKFAISSATGISLNIVYIIFLLFFSKKFGIEELMLVSVVAVSTQLIIQIPSAYKLNYSYSFKINFMDKYMHKTIYLIVPVIIGSMVERINEIVDKTLASELTVGSISALNYAMKFKWMILGVVVSALGTSIFPLLSRESTKTNKKSFNLIVTYVVNVVIILTIPATIGMIILAKPIIRFLFERGAFTSTATNMTANALIFYSIGMVSSSLRVILGKVFYSLKDTKTLMKNGMISVAINVCLNLILVKYMDYMGLALASSIASIVSTIFLFVCLKNKIRSINIKPNLKCFIKVVIASIIMGKVVFYIKSNIYNYFGTALLCDEIILILCSLSGIIVYIVACYILRVKEIKHIINKFILRLSS